MDFHERRHPVRVRVLPFRDLRAHGLAAPRVRDHVPPLPPGGCNARGESRGGQAVAAEHLSHSSYRYLHQEKRPDFLRVAFEHALRRLRKNASDCLSDRKSAPWKIAVAVHFKRSTAGSPSICTWEPRSPSPSMSAPSVITAHQINRSFNGSLKNLKPDPLGPLKFSTFARRVTLRAAVDLLFRA